MQLQPISQTSKHKIRKHRTKPKHNTRYSIANQIAVTDTIKQLSITGVSINSYQAFMQLVSEVLPKDSQIQLNSNHDELGASLQVTIELANASIADCLQWHEKLLGRWTACNEFDLNILFNVMPAKEGVK